MKWNRESAGCWNRKMKVLMINVVCGIRSTGRICTDLAEELEKQGHEVKIAYGRGNVPAEYQKYAVRIGNNFDTGLHALQARFYDGAGFGSRKATEQFIRWVKCFNPDVIHLHNIHGYYIHVGVLFRYLRTCGKKIIWTLHDCWAFTGHCVHFDYTGCDRWQGGCHHCPVKTEYPGSWFADASRKNYEAKRKLFTGISNVRIVTPSYWLAGLVQKSYLGRYPVTVIHNGIDTDVFQPADNDLRKRYHLQGKKVILGVASKWEKRKGLDDIAALSYKLERSFQIILIGLSKKQRKRLPESIITLPETDSCRELAQFYTMADVFLNPVYEDTYPTTNLEAIACGTPVITYDAGGSGESAGMYGAVCRKGNLEELERCVRKGVEMPVCLNDIRQKISRDAFVRRMITVYMSGTENDSEKRTWNL